MRTDSARKGRKNKRAVRIDCKAVLTPTNREWNVLRLYAEPAREKAE